MASQVIKEGKCNIVKDFQQKIVPDICSHKLACWLANFQVLVHLKVIEVFHLIFFPRIFFIIC